MQGKEHVPTDDTRRLVELLAFGKTTQPVIAAALGISDRSLREHHSHELAAKKAAINKTSNSTIAPIAASMAIPVTPPRNGN
jgi:hypothetical protein